MRSKFPGTNTLNPYHLRPSEVEEGDHCGYKIIAVVYINGFWSAYRGPTNDSDEDVAAHGDKLSEKVAAALFPALAHLFYSD